MGIAKDGSHKSSYTRGMELVGKYTLFAEGVRGSLTKQLIAKYSLDANREPGEIRYWFEGGLADRPRQAPQRSDPACVRLALEQFDRRRFLPLPLR